MYIMWVFSNSSPMNGWFTIFLIPEAGQKKKLLGFSPLGVYQSTYGFGAPQCPKRYLGPKKTKKTHTGWMIV